MPRKPGRGLPLTLTAAAAEGNVGTLALCSGTEPRRETTESRPPTAPAQNNMPRVKTGELKEGMVVAKDVKNIDDMLLLPAKAVLTGRQIDILQAWGVAELEVEASDLLGDADPLARLPPEVATQLAAQIKALFWQADDSNPVFAEIFKLMLWRRARKEP